MQSVATGQGKTDLWGKQLRSMREGRGWSRHTLAVKAGVTTSTIWRMEKGEQDPRPTSKNKVIRAFGFTDEEAFLVALFKEKHGVTPTLTTMTDGGRLLEAQSNTIFNAETLEELRSAEATQLPVYRWGACGDPRMTDSAPDPEGYEYPPIGKERLVGARGIGIRVKGNSMTNRRIHDGDIVWANPDKPPRIGRPVLARLWGVTNGGDYDYRDGGMTVKVWKMNGEGGALWGDGEGEEGCNPIICERYEIIGSIVWIQPQGFPPD